MRFSPRSLLLFLLLPSTLHSSPYSTPYVPTINSPFDQSYPSLASLLASIPNTKIQKQKQNKPTKIKIFNDGGHENPQCPLSFHLGKVTTNNNQQQQHPQQQQQQNGIHNPPVIYPIHPSEGPGRNILFLNDFEQLDMLSPSSSVFSPSSSSKSAGIITESVSQDAQYPLLFESSNFHHVSPLLHDINGDGIQDAIVVDYNGGVFLIGLDYDRREKGKHGGERFVKRLQLPRLFVRKSWFEGIVTPKSASKENSEKEEGEEQKAELKKEEEYDPFHSYFEYGTEWKDFGKTSKKLQHGVSGNVLNMDVKVVEGLEERKKYRRMVMLEEEEKKKKRKSQKEKEEANKENEAVAKEGEEVIVDAEGHRRLQEIQEDSDADDESRNAQIMDEEKEQFVGNEGHRRLQEVVQETLPNNKDEVINSDTEREEEAKENKMTAENGDDKDKEEEEEVDGPLHDDRYRHRDDDVAYWHDDLMFAGGDDMYSFEDLRQRYAKKEGSEEEEEEEGATTENDYEKDNTIEHKEEEKDDEDGTTDDYADYHDYYHGYHHRRDHFEDYYPYEHKKSYYNDDYYVRVHPHVLSTPQLFEMPQKIWGDQQQQQHENQYQEKEEFIVFAVSYYYDEDQFDSKQQRHYRRDYEDNDHEEMKSEQGRSMYMSSAVVVYSVKSSTWSVSNHLDLSSDVTAPSPPSLLSSSSLLLSYLDEDGNAKEKVDVDTLPGGGSKMDALALTTPTVADLDANGEYEIIVGTSMGLVYILDARLTSESPKVPVQMLYPIEQRILVEDVIDNDEKLEMFVVDSGGNVICLNSQGTIIWHRYVLEGEEEEEKKGGKKRAVSGTSGMSMGDINGDGQLDIVLTVRVVLVKDNDWQEDKEGDVEIRIYAFDAKSGDDIKNFPLVTDADPSSLDTIRMDSIPQPLLVDLHHDQDHWMTRIRKNRKGDAATDFLAELGEETPQKSNQRRKTKGVYVHGGTADGLHIVQPIGSTLYFIEGGSGCTQTLQIGDTISTMVQADDVHGTGKLDLIITTSSGQILTMESDAVPYHPLNVWNTGATRSRMNAHAQGYSSMQGIFVHDISRQYRDVLGMLVPITFEIFDRRPALSQNDDQKTRSYDVEIRDGTSAERVLFHKKYTKPGVYTEKVHIRNGPGYYALTVRLLTANGIVYDDVFHIGYNIKHMEGFSWMLFMPLVLAAFPLLCFKRKVDWNDDDQNDRNNVNGGGRGLGILDVSR